MDPALIVQKLAAEFIPFLLALCVHEYSHGWVASKLGDPTAKLMGRLTLNPMAHIDPMGTIALPLIGMFTGLPVLGWAKPVPVNGRNLKNERTGMFWVALAGPGSNLLMALIAAFVFAGTFKFSTPYGHAIQAVSQGFMMINIVLAVFNLIPLNPLDGGKIFAIFLPETVNRKLDDMQMISGFLLLALLMTGLLNMILLPPMRFFANIFVRIAAAVLHVPIG